MRKRLSWTLALGAAIAVAVAGVAVAYKPTVIRAGNLILKVNGGISPTKLPKKKAAPISASISGEIETADGSHPPAANNVVADFDKSILVNAKGLPVCKEGQIEARSTAAAKKACPKSIVGSGEAEAEVAFPEQRPFSAKGPLVLFNGGTSGGKTTLYIHLYAPVPAPTALITVVKMSRIHRGHYGLHTVSQLPTIAGGSGSLVKFSLKVNRKFTYKGKKQSYISASCPTGHYYSEANVSFTNGTSLKGSVVRPCTPKG
jgi:hypothetical protein